MNTITIRFYEELNDFLPVRKRKTTYNLSFTDHPSIKHVIEAEGIPHVEVDLILIHGVSVDFKYRIQNGDRVAVYPVFETMDISGLTRLRKKPLRISRFIVDVNSGKVARRLRLLGFDTHFDRTLDDGEIAEFAKKERRIVLTRDIGLLKRNALDRGYWIRSDNPDIQMLEVIRHFDLFTQIKPFSRCMICNGKIKIVAKARILDRIEAGTKQFHNRFFQCKKCGKIYWKGSHYQKMFKLVEQLRSGKR